MTSRGHARLLGTDQVGRDTLSRVDLRRRTSLIVAFSAVILGTTVRLAVGRASADTAGRFDLVSQRVMKSAVVPRSHHSPWPSLMAIGTGSPP